MNRFLGRRRFKVGHAKLMADMFKQRDEVAKKRQALVAKIVGKSLKPIKHKKNRIAHWLSDINHRFIEKCVQTNNDNVIRSPFSNGYSFGLWLKKKGFEYLGSGAHSQVYGKKDSKRVIKVGSSGDAWMNYVLWGRGKGYEGTFVPRVFSYKWYNAGFYVAVVERFERTTSKGSGNKDLDPILLDLYNYAHRGNEYAQLMMEEFVPGLAKFTLDIKTAANDNGWSMDTHGGNFMVRADGSWVATDPVNDHRDPVKTRLRAA